MAEHWAHDAEARARKHAEKKAEPDFRVGELVLLAKAFYEKGLSVILPQAVSNSKATDIAYGSSGGPAHRRIVYERSPSQCGAAGPL